MNFATERQMDEHLRVEHADKIFECEMCSRLHDRSLLIDHMKGHAEETGSEAGGGGASNGVDNNSKENLLGRRFVCTVCGQSFGYNCALKAHVKAKHSTARDYKCKDCQKAFKTSSGLYNHWRLVHYPHFDFPCKQCEFKFKLQHELQRHVMTVHEKEKRYACDQCAKAFFLQDSLTKHKRTHDRGTVFACDHCLFRTTQKRYLVGHLNRKHPAKTEGVRETVEKET